MEHLISIPLMIFLPMIISFVIMSPLFTNNEIAIRRFTKGFLSVHLLYMIIALVLFSSSNPYTAQINFFGLDWIQSLGIKFSFNVAIIKITSINYC